MFLSPKFKHFLSPLQNVFLAHLSQRPKCSWSLEQDGCHIHILSQSYNTTVVYFDISFLAHVLNQICLPNKSSISQASYCTHVLNQIFLSNESSISQSKKISNDNDNDKHFTAQRFSNLFPTVQVMYLYATCILYIVKDQLTLEISFGMLYIFKLLNVLQIFFFY